jgi:hypothetical protein
LRCVPDDLFAERHLACINVARNCARRRLEADEPRQNYVVVEAIAAGDL